MQDLVFSFIDHSDNHKEQCFAYTDVADVDEFSER